jgi:hypothetical protein
VGIEVKLFVDDKVFRVLDFFFGFFQNSDYTGRPSSKPNVYPFKFTIEASKDITFYEWAIHPTMQKKRVKIVFSPVNGMSKSTTIELLDVHCSYCNYHFIATGSQPFVVNFDLSPATIMRDGQVLLKRYWAVTDPEMLNVAPTEQEENEEEKKESILVKPNNFIAGTNIIATIKKSGGSLIESNKTIKIGSFHVDDYWIDNQGVAYFIPPKTTIDFQTSEATIDSNSFDIENDVRTVSEPKESVKSLQDQLDILHKLSDLPMDNNIKFPKSVKDQLLKEGYHRFELALNDLENKFSDPESNKILSDEIFKAF